MTSPAPELSPTPEPESTDISHLHCSQCGAQGTLKPVCMDLDDEDSDDSWNVRHNVQKLECSACREQFYLAP
ncbi:hypothetical protein [Deinococcus aquaticus]|uniref:hypothetical protein n=1 Tax=Deinococcus aquaticus TaxID=328692 RepID=UPI003F48E1D7